MLANKAVLMVFNAEELIFVDNLYVEKRDAWIILWFFLFDEFIFGE